ncbi:peptidoglycan DD-metalloendopeptidase family protein [Wenzhouxiangella sp. AB-CW3]|uniref:peptidoglycan DD-metalloendopeptidase family protein n=1 Tax=Wenzhouxiangella sp. AB-CW3 TaxID=2771012 RepID=UPI001CC2F804|nr:peptidoglycan DD-metalloendopeptidase family protein [Wenzhouxiangella sp. AB-CW3]
MKLRFPVVLLIATVLAGCAPWAPAPVEDRSRGAEPPSPPAQEERVVTAPPPVYEVRRGDTLYSLAFRFGLDWRAVAEWNDIDAPYTIRPGQELRMTAPPAARPSAEPGRPAVAQADPEPEAEQDSETATPDRPEPARETTRAPAPSASSSTRTVGGVEWQWPASGTVQRPFDASATRRGIGIGGQAGEPVLAAGAGEVVYSGTALIGYGELIIIKHSDTLLSAYGYNRSRLVEEGDQVSRGEQIAEMGLNERDEELLHFEIRRDGQPVDPLSYLPQR